MPSFELFERQDAVYQESVLPSGVERRLAIEAGSPMCWYRWVGPRGDMLGMRTFGASAPSADVFKHFGFTVDNVVERAARLLGEEK
jgi:transketolase